MKLQLGLRFGFVLSRLHLAAGFMMRVSGEGLRFQCPKP